jgi:hypothetical protein
MTGQDLCVTSFIVICIGGARFYVTNHVRDALLSGTRPYAGGPA